MQAYALMEWPVFGVPSDSLLFLPKPINTTTFEIFHDRDIAVEYLYEEIGRAHV